MKIMKNGKESNLHHFDNQLIIWPVEAMDSDLKEQTDTLLCLFGYYEATVRSHCPLRKWVKMWSAGQQQVMFVLWFNLELDWKQLGLNHHYTVPPSIIKCLRNSGQHDVDEVGASFCLVTWRTGWQRKDKWREGEVKRKGHSRVFAASLPVLLAVSSFPPHSRPQ